MIGSGQYFSNANNTAKYYPMTITPDGAYKSTYFDSAVGLQSSVESGAISYKYRSMIGSGQYFSNANNTAKYYPMTITPDGAYKSTYFDSAVGLQSSVESGAISYKYRSMIGSGQYFSNANNTAKYYPMTITPDGAYKSTYFDSAVGLQSSVESGAISYKYRSMIGSGQYFSNANNTAKYYPMTITPDGAYKSTYFDSAVGLQSSVESGAISYKYRSMIGSGQYFSNANNTAKYYPMTITPDGAYKSTYFDSAVGLQSSVESGAISYKYRSMIGSGQYFSNANNTAKYYPMTITPDGAYKSTYFDSAVGLQSSVESGAISYKYRSMIGSGQYFSNANNTAKYYP
ncbi:hypothetical protein WP50_39335, partial [Lactiplantibacillus plantarum]